ncbi:MAG: amino acid permease [Candidatus Aenigmarchaeota archaeon]|nr:amino acid permease [Candidatus Aenigmarchaeota archaeon]
MEKLKKELTLFNVVVYGIGVILGAGIYVLIGQGAAIAGNALWLSFVVAAFIAMFTGFSYAELSGRFPKSAAEYTYTKKAFNNNRLAFVVQWIMLFTLVVSAATVALGFGGYLHYISGIDAKISAAILVVVLSAVNYIGIKASTKYNTISTFIEILGLLIIVAIGLLFIFKPSQDFFSSPSGLAGIFSAASLIFFAYIGFEEIVNMSEDTKNARKIIPKALVISLGVSTLFYMLVSVSAISILGSEKLGKSSAPLTEVVSSVTPNGGLIMSLIALFATSNTAMIIMLVASRMLYGLSNSGSLPKFIGNLDKKRTPYMAIAIVMAIVLISLFMGDIKSIALLTDLGIFIVYVFVNSSLIVIRYKNPIEKNTFKSPVNMGKFPVLALFGLLSSMFMLSHFSKELFIAEALVILAGLIVHQLFKKSKSFEAKIASHLFRKSKWHVFKR